MRAILLFALLRTSRFKNYILPGIVYYANHMIAPNNYQLHRTKKIAKSETNEGLDVTRTKKNENMKQSGHERFV